MAGRSNSNRIDLISHVDLMPTCMDVFGESKSSLKVEVDTLAKELHRRFEETKCLIQKKSRYFLDTDDQKIRAWLETHKARVEELEGLVKDSVSNAVQQLLDDYWKKTVEKIEKALKEDEIVVLNDKYIVTGINAERAFSFSLFELKKFVSLKSSDNNTVIQLWMFGPRMWTCSNHSRKSMLIKKTTSKASGAEHVEIGVGMSDESMLLIPKDDHSKKSVEKDLSSECLTNNGQSVRLKLRSLPRSQFSR